jgi:hypothetical protein
MLSYRQKILIDRTIGVCLAFAMDVLARLVGIVLRLDHSVPENPRNIIVAKFMGIGSIVHMGILCRALKEKFPNSELLSNFVYQKIRRIFNFSINLLALGEVLK